MAIRLKPQESKAGIVSCQNAEISNKISALENNFMLSEKILKELALGHCVFLIDEKGESFQNFCKTFLGKEIDYSKEKILSNQKMEEVFISFSSDNLTEQEKNAVKRTVSSSWECDKAKKTVSSLINVARKLVLEHGVCFPIAGVYQKAKADEKEPHLFVIKNFY